MDTDETEGKDMRLKYVVAVLGMLALALNASAMLIGPDDASYSGPQTAKMNASQIGGIVGVSGLSELYKQDFGGAESGTFASSYTTRFSGDPSDALIKYDGAPDAFISGIGNLWLYVKDGNHSPAWYLISLAGWNGTDSLELQAFWPGPGAISHVTILGGGPSTVPDGGTTVILLGSALVGLGTVRRFIKR
jgi:hypothetical protein